MSNTSRRIDKCPYFCRVKVVALGSLDTHESDQELLGEDVVTWTGLEDSQDIFAEEQILGVVTTDGQLRWLSGDAMVEVIEPPRYAGQPEDLIPLAGSVAAPEGSKGKSGVVTREGWHPIIWHHHALQSCLQGWTDPELSVELILLALTHAPDDVRPTLLAGLRARYARIKRNPDTYPPGRYPWLPKFNGPKLTGSGYFYP